jgi:hypothetical protein
MLVLSESFHKTSCSFYLTPAHTNYYPHKALCVVRHLLVCTDHEIHTCARSYATVGWISWKSMHFSWKDDSPLWVLCVSWCQIERAARLRLQLGNLLHLHAIPIQNTILFNIFTLPVKRYLAINTIVTWLKFA